MKRYFRLTPVCVALTILLTTLACWEASRYCVTVESERADGVLRNMATLNAQAVSAFLCGEEHGLARAGKALAALGWDDNEDEAALKATLRSMLENAASENLLLLRGNGEYVAALGRSGDVEADYPGLVVTKGARGPCENPANGRVYFFIAAPAGQSASLVALYDVNTLLDSVSAEFMAGLGGVAVLSRDGRYVLRTGACGAFSEGESCFDALDNAGGDAATRLRADIADGASGTFNALGMIVSYVPCPHADWYVLTFASESALTYYANFARRNLGMLVAKLSCICAFLFVALFFSTRGAFTKLRAENETFRARAAHMSIAQKHVGCIVFTHTPSRNETAPCGSLGARAEEALVRSLLVEPVDARILYPDDMLEYDRLLRSLRGGATREVCNLRLRLVANADGYRWYRMTVSRATADDGETYYLGTLEDIDAKEGV